MPLPTLRLIDAAVYRGMEVENPVLLSMDGPNGVRVNIYVGYEEPVSVTAPLDLLWIRPDTQEALRRASRADSVDFEHTWTAATEQTFWSPQSWDEPRPSDQTFQELLRNIGNTHLITLEDLEGLPLSGGTMSGGLILRPEAEEPYLPSEAVPRNFVEVLVGTAQSLAASVYQQLASVRNSLNVLRGRVTINESKIAALEQNGGGGGGGSLPIFVHNQAEESLEWIVMHELPSAHPVVSVFLDSGEAVIPSEVEMLDAQSLRITFAEPRAGSVSVIGLP